MVSTLRTLYLSFPQQALPQRTACFGHFEALRSSWFSSAEQAFLGRTDGEGEDWPTLDALGLLPLPPPRPTPFLSDGAGVERASGTYIK